MKVLPLQKVENIVAKGEIAHYEQFLILPQCFQMSSASEASEGVLSWKGLRVIFF